MQKGLINIVFLIFLSFCTLMNAQDKKKVDSLLKNGTLEVYENPDKAINTGKQVIALSGKDINLKVKGLLLISDAYSSKRDYQKSLKYIIEAKNLSAKIGNPVLQIKIQTKTAKQYQQLKIYDKALELLEESGRLGAAYPDNDSIRFLIGNNFVIRGFIYKEQLDCDIAIGYFKQGIEQYRGLKDAIVNANLSIATYNMGNCYMSLSNNAEAKNSFAESISYAEKIEAKSLKAFAQKGLAEVYTIEGNYNGAIKVLLEAMSISNSVGDLVLNQGIYKGLSENYLAVNDWQHYRKFHELYLKTQLLITASERKSVSDSLNESAKNLKTKTSRAVFRYRCGILLSVILSLVALSFIIINSKKSGKRLRQLRERVKQLQTS